MTRSILRNDDLPVTHLTPEEVVSWQAKFAWRAINRPHTRRNFVLDPAARTLTMTPECRAKLDKAIMRDVRRMKFRLYRTFARLYFEKLCLQIRGTYLRILRKLHGGIHKNSVN